MERVIDTNVPVKDRNVAPPPKEGWQQEISSKHGPNVAKGSEAAISSQADNPSDTGLRGIEHAERGRETTLDMQTEKGHEMYAKEKKTERELRKNMVESLDAKREHENQMKGRDIGAQPGAAQVQRNIRAEQDRPRPSAGDDPVSRTRDLDNIPGGEVTSNKKGVIKDGKGQPMEQDVEFRPTPVPQGRAQDLSYAQVTAIERDQDIGWNEDPEEARRRRHGGQDQPGGPAAGNGSGQQKRTHGGMTTHEARSRDDISIADIVGIPSTKFMKESQGQGHVMTVSDISNVARKDNEIDTNISTILPPRNRMTD